MEEVEFVLAAEAATGVVDMGQKPIITKNQEAILFRIRESEYLRSRVYFTGGTVLSAYYLKHRYSDDLDLFSETKLDNQTIFTLVSQWSSELKFVFTSQISEVVQMYMLKFKDGSEFKVDFAYYPYKRLKVGMRKDGLDIDSLLDIAVNKTLTISQRTDVKDFVDFYYLEQKFGIWDLIKGLRIKFRIETDPFLMAADYLKVEDFTFMPRMIKPLSLETLKKFFRVKAKEVGEKAVIS